MKKIISILLTLTFLLSLSVEVMADDSIEVGRKVLVDTGSPYGYDKEPKQMTSYYINGEEYLSLPELLQYAPYEERWDNDTKTMELWGPYRTMRFQIGSKEYYANGLIPQQLWVTTKDERIQNFYNYYPEECAECTHFTAKAPIMVGDDIYLPTQGVIYLLFGIEVDVYKETGTIYLNIYPTYYDKYATDFFASYGWVDKFSLLHGRNIPEEMTHYFYTPIVDGVPILGGFPRYQLFSYEIEDVVTNVEPSEIENDYIITLKDGNTYEITCGAEDRINTRCFDNSFKEIKPEELKDLVGCVVRFCHKTRYYWGSPWVEDPDRFMYAMVKDLDMTREYQEEQERLERERPKDKDIDIQLNRMPIDFDQPPIIENDRVLVPMRTIFETMGVPVEWDGENKTITAKTDEATIVLTVDSATAYKNGKAVELDAPARLINDRTLVPLRFVGESLDMFVQWDDYHRYVFLWAGDSAIEYAKSHTFDSYFE